MLRIYLHGFFLIACWLFCGSSVLAQVSLDGLTKTLTDQAVQGKTGSSLILNRGISDGSGIEQTASTESLAKALGFVDVDGKTDPVFYSLPLSTPDWLAKVRKLKDDGKLKSVEVIDIGSPVEALQTAIKAAQQKWQNEHAAFRDYLKGLRFEASAAGIESVNDAKLDFEGKNKALGFFSKRFIVEKAMQQLKQLQVELVKIKPNLTLGGPYAGNFDANTDALILEAWRNKVFTPWVADLSWQNGEFSPKVLGYYLSIARSANNRNPIYCDIHVGSGNYAKAIRRSFFLALAQGAKGIRFVGAIPPDMTKTKESLPLESVESWMAMRECTHYAGMIANELASAKPRQPDVGIVVSLTQELWDSSTWVSEEKKAIYHAARIGGHNIALLSEEDIQEGKFQKLSTIYVVGNHLSRDSAKVLRSWVGNGAVVTCVGGPFKDEYNQPLTDMLELQGIKEASWENLAGAGPAKITLAQQRPLEKFKFVYMTKVREFPLVYGKMKATLIDKPNNLLYDCGKFADGSPAIIKHEYEPAKLGQCWTYCAPLGSGWLKTVLGGRTWEIGDKPTSYNHILLFNQLDGDAGDMVIAGTGDARFDVITDNLDIESVVLEGPKKAIMICINWSNKKAKAYLTVQFLPRDIKSGRSMLQGPLKLTSMGITQTLPKSFEVDVADVVVLE